MEKAKLQKLFLIVPSSWDIEDITVPWPDVEQKLTDFFKIFKHKNRVNEFRDFLLTVKGQ